MATCTCSVSMSIPTKVHLRRSYLSNAASNGGAIAKKVKTFVHGDNIYDHSGEIEAYRDGYTIADINARDGVVEFTNGLQLEQGQVVGDSSEDDIRRIQIRETIMSHLEKERASCSRRASKFCHSSLSTKLQSINTMTRAVSKKAYTHVCLRKSIKTRSTYSLANCHSRRILTTGRSQRDEAHRIHAGYFLVDKKGHAVDSEVKRGEDESSDVDAYDLIMKNKERLLSADEPIRFIFSHSALREG